MKNKSDLKRKVLCSLLAASTMGIFYSTDAFAASVNGKPVEGTITDQTIIDNGSAKFVIGQGNLDLQTNASVDAILAAYQKAVGEDKGKLDALRAAIGVYGAGQVPITGAVGGEGQFDRDLDSMVDLGKNFISNQDLKDIITKIQNIDTVKNDKLVIDGNINSSIGSETNNSVVIGLIGGDLSIGGFSVDGVSADRTGNITTNINNGNLIGGTGASTAVGLGNMEVQVSFIKLPLTGQNEGHDVKTTLKGDVTTNVNNGANVGAFANGGGAIAVGGQAVSTVDGNTNLTINSKVDFTNGAIDGLTAAVTGGGLAVSTIGGTAASEVTGTTNVRVHDGVAIGVIGGGAAAAVDATGVVEAILYPDRQIGNDNGTSDITVSGITVDVKDAIQGGTATATTGDTNITLTGDTTALGVVGGGITAASHTYTWKNDDTNKEAGLTEDNINDAYGSSTATATTGKATIVVNLESEVDPGKVAGNIGGALSSVISAVKGGNLEDIKLSGIAGQGGAVGVFGGGVAFGQGSMRATIDGEGEGAYAAATNEAGADIYLLNGYAAGVFGGGAAGTLNNAKAETNTGAVNTYIGKDMNAVGVFGGGFALSMEGGIGEDGYKGSTNGTLASSNVDSNNIVVEGNVDGIYGGGMAVGNSMLTTAQNGKDAATHVGTTNITVNGGTIDRLQLISIMEASKNDNEDGYVQWNSLGVNASMAMTDLRGITDNTSIAAGGMALGMTGSDTVDVANITINGGTVTSDILGGGIAVDNAQTGSGAHVGESTITVNGTTVGGSIYAGGAVNGSTPVKAYEAYDGKPNDDGKVVGWTTDRTSSTVDNATVVLNGATVEGEISGEGYQLTTEYKDNNFNPFYNNNSLSYTKDVYDSVTGESTLVLEGSNTLKPLAEDGDYTSTSKIHSFTNIKVTADSVTVLDSSIEAGNENALIDANGTTITVADGAKLDVSNLTPNANNVYKVVSSVDDDDTLWTNDALVYDRTETYANAETAEGNYKISYKNLEDLSAEEKTDAVNDFVDSLGEGGENLTGVAESVINGRLGENPGAKEFFSDYTTGNGTSRDLGAMAMIGEAAGVTAGTISVAGDMADNSVLRLSFTQDDITGEPTVNEDGAVWAKYIHGNYDLDGMASSFGSIDSSNDFDGVTVGVDFAKKGKVQSGIAFSYGDGDSHGMGINNDYDMWGVTLYGNVKNDDSNVIADIGFSESDNELSGMAMGKKIKADRDVSVFTVGVRAEKLYTNGNTQIVPYTGLRYYNVDPDSYTAYYNGQKFGEYDAERQNIWTLPVGVSLRNETVTDSGWRITPKADVAYIWAFGDTDNSVDLNVAGGVSTLDYTVMDSGSWLGALGIEAGKDDWCFGVGYSYQKGSHAEADKWYVNVEYSF
ncbi:MAG: hypothetical protein DBY32_02265 [Phascolarctobacterium sp.]|nr:MAG: hypothetical protein DBY32_02265 [Phascolarctobacterium sp.]